MLGCEQLGKVYPQAIQALPFGILSRTLRHFLFTNSSRGRSLDISSSSSLVDVVYCLAVYSSEPNSTLFLLCVQVDYAAQLFHTRDAAEDFYYAVLLHRGDALRARGLVDLALTRFGAQNCFYCRIHKHRLKNRDPAFVPAALAS